MQTQVQRHVRPFATVSFDKAAIHCGQNMFLELYDHKTKINGCKNTAHQIAEAEDLLQLPIEAVTQQLLGSESQLLCHPGRGKGLRPIQSVS